MSGEFVLLSTGAVLGPAAGTEGVLCTPRTTATRPMALAVQGAVVCVRARQCVLCARSARVLSESLWECVPSKPQ